MCATGPIESGKREYNATSLEHKSQHRNRKCVLFWTIHRKPVVAHRDRAQGLATCGQRTSHGLRVHRCSMLLREPRIRLGQETLLGETVETLLRHWRLPLPATHVRTLGTETVVLDNARDDDRRLSLNDPRNWPIGQPCRTMAKAPSPLWRHQGRKGWSHQSCSS